MHFYLHKSIIFFKDVTIFPQKLQPKFYHFNIKEAI